MQDNPLQRSCAYAALFLLPFPALNFGTSFTFGDVFLVLAVLLNAGALFQLQSFQLPFLLALPFFLVSGLLDADGGVISMVQTVYIWGFVLPFGWCAFAGIPLSRMAAVLLSSAVISSMIATGQGVGWIPALANQRLIEFNVGFSRGAGLSLKCNSLVMILTPCFLLVCYLRSFPARLLVIAALVPGMLAAVSKSVLLAIPGLAWFVWREPRRRWILATLAGVMIPWTSFNGRTTEVLHNFSELIDRRVRRIDGSLDNRAELAEIAWERAGECMLYGFGATGSAERVARATNNTVHIYYLGVVLIAGWPGALLTFWGMALVVRGLWRSGERNLAMYVVMHLLACSVMTVLLVSFQSLPLMVAGAALAGRVHLTEPAVARQLGGPRLRPTS